MFALKLSFSETPRRFPKLDKLPDYDEQYDDERSVLDDLCEILARTEIASFEVAGFGQDQWPVTVGTDLAVLLEQVPNAIRFMSKQDYPVYLDFYEQGIQRQLILERLNRVAHLSCISGTSWRPEPQSIIVDERHFQKQLLDLQTTFIWSMEVICPILTSSQLFFYWKNLRLS